VPDGRWTSPLRGALDRLAGGIDAVTERVAADLPGLADPWAPRDRYVDAVIGAAEPQAWAAAELGPAATAAHRARLLDLMEAQRWRLAMFASCGWYWDDPARTETHLVLRSSAVRPAYGQAGRRRPGAAAGRGSRGAAVAPLGIDGATIYRQALAEVGGTRHE
jgi:hypothetical protein